MQWENNQNPQIATSPRCNACGSYNTAFDKMRDIYVCEDCGAVDNLGEIKRSDHLKPLRRWWNENNAEQRAGALRMYVGPTIQTGNGVQDIRTVAEVSFDGLDETALELLIAKSMTIPNFLD